jgi:hypothetical protein
LKEDAVEMVYTIQKFGDVFQRYPENFVGGLSKIGGLIAILKLWFIIRLVHKYNFEKKLANSIQNM